MKANLLRVVRSALARTTPRNPSGHPDANLLAAFAENTLLARERAAVAGHLADCADCREFLALAFASEVAEPAAAAKPRAVRRWSPVWSWAASTAAVCIVVSAVWEFRAQRVAPLEPPPGPPAISAPRSPQVAPVKAATPRRFTAPPIAAPGAAPKQPAAPPPPPALAPQQTADALSSIQQQAPAPQYNQQAEAARPGARYLVQDQAAAAPSALARSAPARMRKESGFGALGHSGSRVLWTIAGSPRGMVQRSDDGGATWKTVPISDEVSFRAVVSSGSGVWAGGSAGALYHSTDSGAHWERVAIDTTGTIVGIRAGDGGEVVVTTDDGRTWHLTNTPH
ncbi:MAG: YCF48-related protein [Bryobacteraceae bacterium]|jgi:hypothetical protein